MRKQVLRSVLGVVAVGVVGFVALVSTRPSTFHIERSIDVAAAPERAFVQVNDFHAWSTWSPYEKLDPALSRSFAGPASGVGAVYAWNGDKAGAGKMTIERSDAPTRIEIRLEFTKPMAATNRATFTFEPKGATTRVTWAMDGANSFLGKAASLFFDMDKLVGGDFERGLATMKANAEANAPVAGSASNAR